MAVNNWAEDVQPLS